MFNQIDYIAYFMVEKLNLSNARSYSGTITESNHRLVVARFNIRIYKLYKPKTEQNQPPHIINRLVPKKNTREQYQSELEGGIRKSEPNTAWEPLRKDVLAAAT